MNRAVKLLFIHETQSIMFLVYVGLWRESSTAFTTLQKYIEVCSNIFCSHFASERAPVGIKSNICRLSGVAVVQVRRILMTRRSSDHGSVELEYLSF